MHFLAQLFNFLTLSYNANGEELVKDELYVHQH